MPVPGAQPPVVRLSSPVDVAAAVPQLLGFVPHASLVVLGLGDGMVRVTGRADLDADPAGTDTQLARMCRHASADHALIVAVVDTPVVPDGPLPATGRVVSTAQALGVPVLLGLCLHRGRVWVYDAPPLLPGLPGWPPGGAPVPPGEASPLALARVLRGRPVHPDRAALLASLAPAPPAVRAPVLARTHGWRGGGAGGSAHPAGAAFSDTDRAAMLRTWVRARQAGRVGTLPAAGVTARLLRALTDTLTRDLIIMATDRGRAPESLLLAIHLLRCAGPGLIAPAGALVAWFAYLDGQGVLAGAALERARADNPRHRLAALLEQALDEALPPAVLEASARQAAIGLARSIDRAGPLAGWRDALIR
jgi:hypothetical protein